MPAFLSKKHLKGIEEKPMNNTIQPLIEIVRKVDSKFHDPDVHGQGVVVAWNKSKNTWASAQGVFGKMFNQKNIDYYFVKTQSKPIQIKNIDFEWLEGTSNISLAFEANFQINIKSQQDAEKLLLILFNQNAISVDQALYQVIDGQLHNCMEKIYASCNETRKNLLDEFYRHDTHKGKSLRLDTDVTTDVNNSFQGMGFKIGFALRNAPDRGANFSHCTTLKKSPSQKEFDVQSECTLKLSSYQFYKESGFNHLDDVVAHMKKVIDQTIYQYVSGKTLFDLFCNFDSTGEESGKESISRLVRDQVEAEAASVGYQLQSFYSLPDVAPLKLLKGIRIDIVDNEGSFSTSYSGGKIKINVSMDVEAEQDGIDKLMHLLLPSGDSDNRDVLDISYIDLVQCIKKPIISICANVIKQHDYQTASIKFDSEVKPSLETELTSEMSDLFGLKVTIKSMFSVETEDASRLRELSGRSQPFKFSIISHGSENGELLVEFQSAFKVIGIDMNSGWDAFEIADFGYRSTSPIRKKITALKDGDQDYDSSCKTIAIADELKDIGDEIVRYFKTHLELIPNLYAWYRDAAANRMFQEELLNGGTLAIKRNRGLEVYIENITMDDKYLTQEAIKERKRNHKYIKSLHIKRNELLLDDLDISIKRKNEKKNAIVKQEVSEISEITDIDKLNELEQLIKDPLENVSEPPESISHSLSRATQSSQSSAYNDVIKTLMKKSKNDEKNDEGDL